MNARFSAALLIGLYATAAAIAQAPLGTVFTYQGQLKQSGTPVTNTADFQFSLWDAATSGAQIGSTVAVAGVSVDNGLFTAPLDFGAGMFTGDARWLQIAVRAPAGGGSYTTLSPRQPITPAPYALHALEALSSGNVWLAGGGGAIYYNGGKVGIGTDTPTRPLTLLTPTNQYGLTHTDGTARMSTYIDSTTGGWLGTETNHALNFYTNSSGARMTLTSAGKVGIGTAGPARDFELRKAVDALVDMGVANSSSGSSARTLLAVSCDTSIQGSFLAHSSTYTDAARRSRIALLSEIGAAGLSLSASDPAGDLRFYTGGFAADKERLRIDASGNVGVGTIAPGARLHAMAMSGHAVMGQGGWGGLGVYGVAGAGGGAGVMGFDAASGAIGRLGDPQYAVYGEKPGGYAGYFDGNVHVTGDLTLGGSVNVNAWSLTGNAGTIPGAHFLGTTDNQPLELRVNNTRAFRIIPPLSPIYGPNVIAGHADNYAAGGITTATIAGGGDAGVYRNAVTGNYAAVGGGLQNTAGEFGAIAGGAANTAAVYGSVAGGVSNQALGAYGAVGGGDSNNASGNYSSISGGIANVASASAASVGGGRSNKAGGINSTVPGGLENQAGGHWSFAAGRRAKVRDAGTNAGQSGDSDGDEGAFVWSDASTNTLFTSTGPNQFLVRATGGVGINTTNPWATLTVNVSNPQINPAGLRIDGPGASMIAAGEAPGWIAAGVYAEATTNDGVGVYGENKVADSKGALGMPDRGVYGHHLGSTAYAGYFEGRGYISGNVGIGTTNMWAALNVNVTDPQTNPAGLRVVGPGASMIAAGEAPGWIAAGVYGEVSTHGAAGVCGEANTNDGIGVYGHNEAWDTVGALGMANRGVYGSHSDPAGYAGYFAGRGYFSGNVGIGIAAPEVPLHLSGGTDVTTNSGGALIIGVTNAQNIAFDANEIMARSNGVAATLRLNDDGGDVRISNVGGGRLGVGMTPAANRLEVNGDASKTTAGSWLANSDARIKTDVRTVTSALETLDKIRPVSFRYTDDYRSMHPDIADRRYLNVIAQEFAEVFPDYVKPSGERLMYGGDILQVDTYPLTIYSAAAVKELNQTVQQQQCRIDELTARIEKLEKLLRSGNTPAKETSR